MAETKDVDGIAQANRPGLAVNATVEPEVFIPDFPHVFLGLTFYNNGTQVTPSGGTINSVKVETINNPGVWQSIENGTAIDATQPQSTLSVRAHITAAQIITTGITGADSMTLRVSASRT